MLTIFISVGQLVGTAAVGLLSAAFATHTLYHYLFHGVALLLFSMLALSLGLKNKVYND